MLDNFEFANVNAKIKAMYSKFLSYNDYQELIKQENLRELIILLKSKIENFENISDKATRQEIEKKLYDILLLDIKKIYPLLNKKNQDLIEVYIEKLKYNNRLLVKDEFYKEYFYKLFKKVDSYKEKALTDIVGKQIDLYNILSIFRSKKYYNQKQDYDINIHYKLSKDNLEYLKKEKSLIDDILGNTIYRFIRFDEDKIEKDIQEYLFKLYIIYFKTNSFNIAMVISYFELLQIQIKNIISIVEGVEYNLNLVNIQNQLIRIII